MRWLAKSVVLLVPFLLATALVGQDYYEGHEAVSRQVLVKFRPGQEGRLGEVAAELDIDNARQVGNDRVILMRSRSRDVTQLVRALAQRPYVQFAEPDYILRAIATPNDPYFSPLWGMTNIDAPSAWDVSTGAKSVVVGVIDTGVDYSHQDLQENIWSAPSAFMVTVGGRTFTCPQGSHGYNAIANSCDPADDNDHGTHVSGTIGAVGDNGIGVVGVNWATSIMGLKFLNRNGSGFTSDAIEAIDFAIQAKAVLGAKANVRVLSNSWGGGGFSQALLDAINRAQAADMLFVAAAGNAGSNNDITPSYPASYNAANVVAVAAIDSNNQLASWSNYGKTSVDLGAPGVSIYSTIRSSNYASFSGTSMATPHVSGAAALVLSKCGLTTADLKETLLNSVVGTAALAEKTSTGGRLNVNQAIRACAASTPDFTIAATPASASVTQGGTATYTVSVGALGGFTGTVALSVSGQPAGVTFSPTSVTVSGTSLLTVNTSASTLTGTYNLTITGTSVSPALVRTTTVTLVVTAPTTPSFTLTVSPSSVTVPRTGGPADYTLTVTASGGFGGVVGFSVAGQPTGSTATFTPTTVTGSESSIMRITVPPNAKAKTYPLVVTATSGSIVKTVNAALVVKR